MKTPLFASVVLALCCRADVVILHNGDRVSGRVESLAQGRLRIRTEWAGAVNIDWRRVEQLWTDQPVNVEAESGLRWTGALDGAPGQLVILTGPAPVAVPFDRVRTLEAAQAPARPESFRSRLTGSADVGYSLTRGNSRLNQSSLGLTGRYRTDRRRIQGELTSLFSRQSDAPSTSRHTGSARYDHFFTVASFSFALAGLERDDRQRLNLRTNAGGGLGWKVIHSPRTELALLGGFTYTDEQYRSPAPSRRTSEALVELDYESAAFGRVRLISKFSMHPNLIDRGRYRIVYDGGLRAPLVYRFTWNLRLFDRFDSRPPLDVQRNDYGVVSGLGVTF